MTIREVHYIAATDGENTNYYRVRVGAQTKLGVAQYRSGWYSARAVDSLFGAVSSDGGVAATAAKAAMEEDISDKIRSTTQKWLEEASKPDADPKKLEGLMEARRRVLAYPKAGKPPFPDTSEMEFNPAAGISVLHSDEKLVFILSSNPDEVIGKIKNFSENEQTVLTIKRLSDVVLQKSRNDALVQTAIEGLNKKTDALVQVQLQAVIDVAAKEDTLRDKAIDEIDSLLSLIDGVQR